MLSNKIERNCILRGPSRFKAKGSETTELVGDGYANAFDVGTQ